MRKFMKLKSITALVLAIALVFSSFATVYAADETPGSRPTETELVEVGQDSPGVLGDEHTHCFCGGNCDTATAANGHTCLEDGSQITYEAIGDFKGGKLTAGVHALYLDKDLTFTSAITVEKDTTLYLCLNGHTLTGATNNRVVMMYDSSATDAGKNSYLYICDCSAEKKGKIQGTGKLANNDGGMFALTRGSHFYLFGGTVVGGGISISDSKTHVGGIVNVSSSEFYMYGGTLQGGTITDTSTTKQTPTGGCVDVNGTMVMYGGEIKDGNIEGGQGGNVRIQTSGKFRMVGGTISGGSATNGGNLCVTGLFIMEGGLITGGKAGNSDPAQRTTTSGAGNIFTNSKTTSILSIQGGRIDGHISMTITKDLAVSGTAVIHDLEDSPTSVTSGIYLSHYDNTRENNISVGKYDMNKNFDSTAHLEEGSDVVVSYFKDTVNTDREGLVARNGNESDLKYMHIVANASHQHLMAATAPDKPADGIYISATHCYCGDNCATATEANGHTHVTTDPSYTIIDNFTSPAASVNPIRYLALKSNMTWKGAVSWKSPYTLVLCLNGFTLTIPGSINVQGGSMSRLSIAYSDTLAGAKLIICDCIGTGKIVSTANLENNEYNSTNGGLIVAGKGAHFEMYGGTISSGIAYTQVDASTTGYGGNIASFGGGGSTIKIYGGVVENGYAETTGGNIHVAAGDLYLYGGTIRGGYAGTDGGNIFFNGPTFYMGPDVVIEDGYASKFGGNIAFSTSATSSTFDGGTVKDGKSGQQGGNIYFNGKEFNMTSGTVENGLCGQETESPSTATGGQGGNMWFGGGKVTISGGLIQNGECQNIGGNIVVNSASMKVTGGKVINGYKNGSKNIIVGFVTSSSASVLSISGNAELDALDPIYAKDLSFSGAPTIGSLYMTRGSANRVKDQRIGGLDSSWATTDAHLSEGASIKVSGLDPYAKPEGMLFRNGNASDINFITVPKDGDKVLQVLADQKDDSGFFYDGATFSGIFYAEEKEPEPEKPEYTHFHCICGGNCTAATPANGHTCDATQGWEAIGNWNSLAVNKYGDNKRYVYLASDMTEVNAPGFVAGDELYVCLNGKTLTVPKNLRMALAYSGQNKIVICDCQGGGKVVSTADASKGEQNSTNGGLIGAGKGATVEIYGGTLSGGVTGGASGNGYGGNIALFGDNTTTGASTIRIYGGTIENGVAGTYGGNIATTNGGATACSSCYIYGGTIQGGEAKTSNGGNISACTQFVMKGGTVKNGKSATQGGNLYIGLSGAAGNPSTFEMTGGSILDGEAKTGGGNLAFYAWNKTCNITAGLISGGKVINADCNGGNIYFASTPDVTIGSDGSVEDLIIKDGVSEAGGAGNIYISGHPYVKFKKATISGGQAFSYGGNIVVNSDPTEDNVPFKENTGKVTFTGTLVKDGVADGKGIDSYAGNITINHKSEVIINEGTVITNGVTTGIGANIRVLGWSGRSALTVNGGEISGGSCNVGGSVRLENGDFVVNDGIFLPATQTGSDHTVSNISITYRTTAAAGVTAAKPKFTINGGYFAMEDISEYSSLPAGSKFANSIHVDKTLFDPESEIKGGYIEKVFVHPENPNRKVITGGYFMSNVTVYLKDAEAGEATRYVKTLETPVTYDGYPDSEEFGFTISQGYKVSLSAKAIAGAINVSGLQGAGWYDAATDVTLLLPYENNGYTLQYLMVGDEKVELADIDKDEHGICTYVIEGLSADVTVNAYYAFQVESVYLNVDAADFIFDGDVFSGPIANFETSVGQHTIEFIGEGFKYWVNESGNVVCGSIDYTFNASADGTIKAVTEAATPTVVFLSDYGQILKTIVTAGEGAAFDFIDAPYHVGKSAQWTLRVGEAVVANSTDVWANVAKGTNYIELIPHYEALSEEYQNIQLYKVVTDKTAADVTEFTKDNCVFTKSVELGEVDAVIAPGAETGETLLGIYTSAGQVASRTTQLTLRAITTGDVDYYAVYTTASVTPTETPVIRMLDLTVNGQGSGKYTFIYTASHMAGGDFKVVERGILFTNQTRIDGYNESLAPGETALTPAAALKYNFVNSVCSKYVANTATNVGTITLNVKNVPIASYGDVNFQAVGYLIYTLNGKQYITYSDVQSACLYDFVD